MIKVIFSSCIEAIKWIKAAICWGVRPFVKTKMPLSNHMCGIPCKEIKVKWSLVSIKINPINLVFEYRQQENFYSQMRLAGLIIMHKTILNSQPFTSGVYTESQCQMNLGVFLTPILGIDAIHPFNCYSNNYRITHLTCTLFFWSPIALNTVIDTNI